MKITIAGGSGFLGSHLREYFQKLGHEVLILTRKPKQKGDVAWNGRDTGKWCEEIDASDVLINLSGKSVDCRYTEKNKLAILSSRTQSTFTLHDYIFQAKKKPRVWLNASSATTYIHAETELMTENQGRIGDDFSMNICKEWEKAFFARTLPEIRQVALRTSIVLGRDGGAFPKLKFVTKLGLGGYQGLGNQKVSWIHIEDFCRAIDFIIENETLSGAINVTTPTPISNKELMNIIRKGCKVPFGFSQPVALLEIGAALIGTETELLLKSRNVYPEKLINEGFKFNFPKVPEAVATLF